MIRSIVALALLFGIVHAPAALAETTGRLVTGPLTFTLTDLNPNDGITPSLVFDPMPYIVEPWLGPPRVTTSGSTGSESLWDYVEGGGNTLPLASSSALAGRTWAQAEMGGREEAGTHWIDVSAGVIEASGSEWQQRHAGASAMTGIFYFEITPNTAVTFNLPVDLTGFHQVVDGATTSLDVHASLYMHMSGVPEIWADSWLSRANLRSNFTLQQHDVVSITHDNTAGVPQRGIVIVQAGVSIHSYTGVSPVPEPSGAAMLVAGLVVTGLWSFRRRSKPRR
jgi:hypothetical protein